MAGHRGSLCIIRLLKSNSQSIKLVLIIEKACKQIGSYTELEQKSINIPPNIPPNAVNIYSTRSHKGENITPMKQIIDDLC